MLNLCLVLIRDGSITLECSKAHVLDLPQVVLDREEEVLNRNLLICGVSPRPDFDKVSKPENVGSKP